MRSLPLLFVLALVGCAARAPEPKLRFSEVFRAPEQLRTESEAKKADAAVLEAKSSLELQGALLAFSVRARHFRSGSHPEMPSEAIQNWDAVMTAVDASLAQLAKQTSSYDVIRARLTLETELELDARAYDAISEELITAVELRKARLALRLADLRRLKVRPRVMQPDFIWPISPVAVTSLFGRRLHPISRTYKPHTGVDLAASFGQEIYAASAGTVLKSEWTGGYGNHVEIQHAGNVVTRYSHLADALVEPGQMVKQGQPIGLAGNTGTSTGVHLHFELWVNGRPADPLDELMDPSRSLPVATR